MAFTATGNFSNALKVVARCQTAGLGRSGHPDVCQANPYMNFCERPFAVAIGGQMPPLVYLSSSYSSSLACHYISAIGKYIVKIRFIKVEISRKDKYGYDRSNPVFS